MTTWIVQLNYDHGEGQGGVLAEGLAVAVEAETRDEAAAEFRRQHPEMGRRHGLWVNAKEDFDA